jgi:ribonuclease HI
MSKLHQQLQLYLFKNKLNEKSLTEFIKEFSSDTVQNIINDLKINQDNIIIKDRLYIFSDGNCRGNGKKHAKAGYSVYFGDTLHSNFNKTRLIAKNPSNNVAELSGVKQIYKTIYQNQVLFKEYDNLICTDSQYAINCIEKWSDNWIKNGWKNSKGEQVKNKELIEEILIIKNAIPEDIRVTFKHVYGHTKEPSDKTSLEWTLWNGNNIVDTNINKLFDL